MKTIFYALVISLLVTSCTKQNNTETVDYNESFVFNREKKDFFPTDSLMPVGAYYYPEHWSSNQWERDLKKMAELGFDFTHFGEFAWSMMEPTEGNFDFGWLDSCVTLADKYGLKVIMCTPTPTPPVWLTSKYPEVLTVNENNTIQRHGGRLHANGMNPIYRKYVERIVSKLAERYGNDKRIWGWQIDNEPHFAPLYDYSETAQVRFRAWLKRKYLNIEALNKAWGTPFWSQVYNNFEQIRIPNRKENAAGSPHSIMDFQRFTADEIAAFLRYQANILKEKVNAEQWITTNFAYYKFLPSVDLFQSKGDMDFASHTMYLLSTYLNYPKGDMAYRLGSGMELSFSNEWASSIEGYTGIMELQPGQINWGAWNSQPLPGAVRMWLWHSFGLGDKFVCTYRFRQPIYGGEQFHKGIMETDGITVARGGKEYVQVIDEMKELRKHYQADIKEPRDYAGRKTAFLWKQSNLFDMENDKHNLSWDTWQHYYTYYENLKTLGSPVTFIQETDEFDPALYPFMIAPAYSLVDSQLIAKWEKYTSEGGHLILSCRSGMKDNNGHLWEKLLQQPIWNLIGASVMDYDHMPPSAVNYARFNNKDYAWNVWGDFLQPFEGTEVLATHTQQYYAGTPCVVYKKTGKGSVTYIGAWSTDSELERVVMREVYNRAGADILNQDRYVFTEWRDGFWVTLNYSSADIQAPVHDKATILVGEKTVKPGGVCVWKESNN